MQSKRSAWGVIFLVALFILQGTSQLAFNNEPIQTEITENNGFNRYDYNDLNGDTYVRHFKIINGGHTWDDEVKYGGKSSSQIVWEFVSLFNLSGIIK